MKHAIFMSLLTAVCYLPCSVSAAPVVIDDTKLLLSFERKLGRLAEAGNTVHTDELLPQLARKTCTIEIPKLPSKKVENIYQSVKDSVVMIASVYKCDKCPKWHAGSTATAWVLTSDGVMVTNYHVFRGKEAAGFGIRTHDGKVAPVVEILAANERDDVAIFRVKGSDFKPLALGENAVAGDSIHIVAHPNRRFYTYTAGYVSRYFRVSTKAGGKADSMSVTAAFAVGSSGGPVVNDLGGVVGMVASTKSIYSGSKNKKDPKGDLQMVVGNCVPIASIKKLLESKTSQE